MGKTSWDAEPGIELGPALQQVDRRTTIWATSHPEPELRRTLSELRRTLPELRRTLSLNYV